MHTMFITLLISCSGASNDSSSTSTDSSSETSSNTELGTISTPSLTVSSLPSSFSVLSPHITKYSEVFGIHIFATPDVTEQKIIHAANILAQYLDNNEDGTVDNALVLTQLRNRNASIFITPTEASFESLEETLEPLVENLSISAFQTLFESEIAPSAGFDASLEELLHLITEMVMRTLIMIFLENERVLLLVMPWISQEVVNFLLRLAPTLHQPGTPMMIAHAIMRV